MTPGCCPAGTDGMGGAVITGLNMLPPVGLKLFSVGEDGVATGLDDGVVAVVVVGNRDVVVGVEGACVPVLSHPATATIATAAIPPATTITR